MNGGTTIEQVESKIKDFEERDSCTDIDLPDDCEGNHLWMFSGEEARSNHVLYLKECMICEESGLIEVVPR